MPAKSEVDLADAIIVHNHTEVRAISDSDLKSAAIRSARGIVVVLPDGTTLRLTVSNPQDWPIDELLDRNDESWHSARQRMGEISGHPSSIDRFHQIVIEEQRRRFADIGVIMRRDAVGS